MYPTNKLPEEILNSNHNENGKVQEGFDSDLPEEPFQSSEPSSHSSSFFVGSTGSDFSHFSHVDEEEGNTGEGSPRGELLHDKKYLLKLRRLFGESSESVASELIKLSGSFEDKKQHEKKMEKLSKMLGEGTHETLKIGEGKTPPTDGEQNQQHQKTKIRNVVGKLMRATKLSPHSGSPASKDSSNSLTPKSPKSPLIKIGEMEIEPGSLQEKLILEFLEDRLLEVQREEEIQKYSIAFGVRRGCCSAPCECFQYVAPTTDPNKGGNCTACGHYPAHHKNLGLVAPESKNTELAHGLKTEIEAIKSARVRSQSLFSPKESPSKEHRNRGLTDFGSPTSAFRRVKEERQIPALKLDFSNETSHSNTPQEDFSPATSPPSNSWVSALPYGGQTPRTSTSANATPRNSNPSTPRASITTPVLVTPRTSNPATPRTSNPATPRNSNPTPVTPRTSNPVTPRNSNPPTPNTPRLSNTPRPGSAPYQPQRAISVSNNNNNNHSNNTSPRKDSGVFAPITKSPSPERKSPQSPPGGGLLAKFRSLSPTNEMLMRKRQESVKIMVHSASFPMTGTTVPIPPNAVVHGFLPSEPEIDQESSEHNSEVSHSGSTDSITEDIEFTRSLQRSPPMNAKKGLDSLNINPSWIIDGKELTFLQKLASGSSAKVFKGAYRNQEVAIKVLKTLPEGKQLEDFKKEFEIMSCLRSPNVVYFYGTVLTPKVCIVMEYCSKGSLFDVLKDESVVFDWARFFKFSIEGMRGVNCLHSWKPQIVHRDLKSLNLLIDEHWICKLADFGTSRFLSGKQSTLGKMRGTYAYCCPEVYFAEPFTAKSDIYSFGIILWEMIVRVIRGSYERPFSEYPEIAFDFQIILQAAKHNLRPKIPPTCPDALADLVQSCWASQPENRLDSKEALEKLLDLQKSFEKEPKPWNKAIEKKKGRRFSIYN